MNLLTGIRVIDMSQYLPGPFAGQILADMGADVVKVEPPAGDPMRRFDAPDEDGLAASYKLVNAGKRVVRLDLKSESGRAAARDLLALADVLIESYRPGTLDRLGFSRETLTSLNPKLVHCALSGWGQHGPYRDRAGHDSTYMSIAGALHASGTAAQPVLVCPPMSDHASATQAALAIAAALFARERTGRGAHLDISMMETVLGWQGIALTLAARGQDPGRGAGMITGGAAYYQVYRCADGRFVILAPLEPKFWRAFCEAVARPDWIGRQTDPLPQTALIAEVASLFGSRPRAHWEAVLGAVDCCFEPVLDPVEVPEHPQIKARGQVAVTGQSSPLVETLIGLRVDGEPPPRRPRLAESDVVAVLAAWGA